MTDSMSELVLHTPFIWVFISTYVDIGTEKLPISSEIKVRDQWSTSKIWILPLTTDTPSPDYGSLPSN